MKLHVINTETFKLDGGAMFGVVPKVIWNNVNPADDKNLCTWAMRCLLIEDGDRKILIDTGLGNKQSDKFFSYYEPTGPNSLQASINNAGIIYDEITDVILTHLHFDHCGDAVTRNENNELIPTFKNAKYWSNKAHWESAKNPNARERASFLKENFLPLEEQGVVEFVEEGDEFLPGITARFFDGHTNQMMVPHINYNGKTIAYMADLLPSAGHIPLAWVMAYDIDPLQTLKEKGAYLKEAFENDYTLFLEHDKDHECCNLQMTEKGIRLKDTFKLSEI